MKTKGLGSGHGRVLCDYARESVAKRYTSYKRLGISELELYKLELECLDFHTQSVNFESIEFKDLQEFGKKQILESHEVGLRNALVAKIKSYREKPNEHDRDNIAQFIPKVAA
jgi:hypothetical protein